MDLKISDCPVPNKEQRTSVKSEKHDVVAHFTRPSYCLDPNHEFIFVTEWAEPELNRHMQQTGYIFKTAKDLILF